MRERTKIYIYINIMNINEQTYTGAERNTELERYVKGDERKGKEPQFGDTHRRVVDS